MGRATRVQSTAACLSTSLQRNGSWAPAFETAPQILTGIFLLIHSSSCLILICMWMLSSAQEAPPSQLLYLTVKSKPLTTRCSRIPVTKCRCPVERSSGLPSASLFCMSNVGKATALTIPHLWRKLRHASKDSANTSVHVLHRYPMIGTWTSNGFG